MLSFVGAALIGGSALGQVIEAPIPRVGDVREYQFIDDWTSQVRSEDRYEVIGVIPDFARLRVESRSVDPKTRLMEARPPEEETVRADFNVDYYAKSGTTRRMNYAWPLQAGKKWTYDYTTQAPGAGGAPVTAIFKMAAEAVGWESVTTPAGTFRTMKVVHKGTGEYAANGAGAINVTWVMWYSQDVQAQVKSTYQWDSSTGTPGTRSTTLLTSFKRARP